MQRLSITNCFRLFDTPPTIGDNNSSPFLSRFPNLESIAIELISFPDGLPTFLGDCAAKHVSIRIDNGIDRSADILQLVAARNCFASDRPGIATIQCQSQLVRSIGELIGPDLADALSIPFVLEIVCETAEMKAHFDSCGRSGATFEMRAVLVGGREGDDVGVDAGEGFRGAAGSMMPRKRKFLE